ncbi:UNVERIFIED_CONTAM: hypothetical protein Slati_0975500 [Sesamum latifolium]|uniref:RNase H type-1 domain-containing protein n=1 Tax=Sesamum latifolium TaxID=2727402 RepID=A0AAW2XR67_9LAMI
MHSGSQACSSTVQENFDSSYSPHHLYLPLEAYQLLDPNREQTPEERSKLWKPKHLKGDLIAANYLKLPLLQNLKNHKSVLIHWSKPGPRWYKLNTDGASKGNLGASGAGGLLRDHKGLVLFAFLEPLGISTNTSAELQALYRGLQICLEKGFHKVWIEVDTLHIIQLISKRRQGAWYHQTLLHKIRLCLAQMETKISHIYREGNRAADLLANQACACEEYTLPTNDQMRGKIIGITRLDSYGFPKIRTM